MAYAFRPGDLPKLDLQVDRGNDFKAWKTQWEAYLNLSGLGAQSQTKQVQALTLCVTRETLTIVENLGLSETQRGSVEAIVTAIQRYVEGYINESVERRHFRQRKQQHGESFNDFLVSLRELAKTCKFCSDEYIQKSIRDQIVEGLMDGDTVEDLLKESDLTLEATTYAVHKRQPNNSVQKSLAHHLATRPSKLSTDPPQQVNNAHRPAHVPGVDHHTTKEVGNDALHSMSPVVTVTNLATSPASVGADASNKHPLPPTLRHPPLTLFMQGPQCTPRRT